MNHSRYPKYERTHCYREVNIDCTAICKPVKKVEVTLECTRPDKRIQVRVDNKEKPFFTVSPGFVDVKNEEFACSICLENKKSCAFAPCGHLATCYICAQNLKEKGPVLCPLCRVVATSAVVLNVFV